MRQNIVENFGGGNLIIAETQNDICSISNCKILPGEQKFAFFDDVASYRIALPKNASIATLVEKYSQVVGIYTENYDQSYMSWQIIAYHSNDFRICLRHFDNGGVTLMTDDCEAIIYVVRHHNVINKVYCWTRSAGIVGLDYGKELDGVYADINNFYLPNDLEIQLIKSL